MHPSVRARGFTLIELLVVIAVIAALASMGFPIWGKIRRDAEIRGTKNLIEAVALAITSYQRKDWSYLYLESPTNPQPRVCNLWDLNNDHKLDGRPTPGVHPWIPDRALTPEELFPGGTHNQAAAPATLRTPKDLNSRLYGVVKDINPGTYGLGDQVVYAGFYDMANPQVGSRFINKNTGELRDAWGEPLHIAFAANTYGTVWFGVWSSGPDRVSAPDMTGSDDICSWK